MEKYDMQQFLSLPFLCQYRAVSL